MRSHDHATSRPSVWLISPVITAFTVFGWAHQELIFVALCSLSLIASYFHHGFISLPTRQRWYETAFLALAAWLLCVVYYLTVLQAGNGLPYFPRGFYKPWLISTSGMMQTIAIVWLWHLPCRAHRKAGPIIGCAGLIVASSCNLLDTSPTSLNLLAAFGGATLFSLFALGKSLQGEQENTISETFRKSTMVLGCIVIISGGTWLASTGVRGLDQLIDRLILTLSLKTRYPDRLGAGDQLHIKRQRRLTPSPRVIATITPSDPTPTPTGFLGYFRTQVFSTYHNHEWTSQPTPHRPLQGNWAPRANRSHPFLSAFDGQRWYTTSTSSPAHLSDTPTLPATRFDVHLHVDFQGAVPLPYPAQRVGIPATLSCLLTSEAVLQCTPSGQLVTYHLEAQLSQPPMQPGIGATLRSLVPPLVPMEIEPEFRQAVQQSRTAPTSILDALRPLAQQLAGSNRQPPLEVAQTIQDHFRQHYRYSLDVNLAKTGDPIVDFVLKQRPAYCEYFASGMVLLLRALDIPSRVVGGFLVREYNPLAEQWIVRQRDAHAWVEVFDASRDRWVAFDPTPSAATQPFIRDGIWGALDEGLAWMELQLRDQLIRVQSGDLKTHIKRAWSRTAAGLYRPRTFVILSIMILAGFVILKRKQRLGLSIIQRWWQFQRSPHKQRLHPGPPDQSVAATQHEFSRVAVWLEQRGWPIDPAETLPAYIHRLAAASPRPEARLLDRLEAFTQSYTRLRFQPYTAQEFQVQLAHLHALSDEIVHTHTVKYNTLTRVLSYTR